MNIYRALAVREIKKKKKEFMNQDTSINNRPVADGVLPSPPPHSFNFGSSPIQASQNYPVHVHTRAHTRTNTAWLWMHEFLSSSALSHMHAFTYG